MEKIPGGKSSNMDLLARFLDLVYVIPPAVKANARNKKMLVRMNLPEPRGRKFWVRARDSRLENAAVVSELSADTCLARDSKDVLTVCGDNLVDAEADPAHDLQLGTGPGHFACSCCCNPSHNDLKRRRLQELLCNGSNFRPSRLTLLRVEGNCVLGVLPSGYVLGGSGTVKGLIQKRA